MKKACSGISENKYNIYSRIGRSRISNSNYNIAYTFSTINKKLISTISKDFYMHSFTIEHKRRL